MVVACIPVYSLSEPPVKAFAYRIPLPKADLWSIPTIASNSHQKQIHPFVMRYIPHVACKARKVTKVARVVLIEVSRHSHASLGRHYSPVLAMLPVKAVSLFPHLHQQIERYERPVAHVLMS